MLNKIARLLFVVLLLHSNLKGQNFKAEVEAFQKVDSLDGIPTQLILFIGSSSFTLWKNLPQNFHSSHTILNRAFGGSTLLDQLYWYDIIIKKYKPAQIIIYCGENDLAADSTITGAEVYKRFKNLYKQIRNDFGEISVVYVSMKPSPARWYLKQPMKVGNKKIKNFLRHQPKSTFINIWRSMLVNHKPNINLFISDSLHMNATGYEIWQRAIQPYLLQ